MLNGQIVEQLIFPSPNPSVRLYLVTYLSKGLKVKGLLAKPKKIGQYEGILYLRGGIKSVGMVRPARIAQMASYGFIVFAPFYRGNWGGEGNEDFAGEDRYDAFSGFQLLSEQAQVMKKRIHIFGFSRGGTMALWTGIYHREAASVVTWGGVSDVALTYAERKDLRRMMKRVIGGSPYSAPNEYTYRTPLYSLEKLQSPVLIVHGERDENVSIDHAIRLEKRLKNLNKRVESWYFTNLTHYFPPSMNRVVLRDLCHWMKMQSK